MATIQHEDITDPKIHEPKGASSASNHTVYIADGAGSGAWSLVDSDSLDLTDVVSTIQDDLDDATITVTGKTYVVIQIADISTAQSVLVPIIHSCTVSGASVVLAGAITTADAKVSFKNSSGASMGTDVTVAYDSSAKGDQYAFTPTGNNVLTGPTWIEIATDGASDTAQPVTVAIELEYELNN